ncbi:MAG: diphosphomevalonate decarboxylase [Bacteroidales bacterium]
MILSSEVPWNAPIEVGSDESLRIGWESPANIAFVKYWGKHGQQLPANPSVSLTLSKSISTMELIAMPTEQGHGHLKYFYFEGQPHPDFALRFGTFIRSLHSELPFLADFDLIISSSNSFPHSAGIASSASGFSALALCLCTLENDLHKDQMDKEQFLQKASIVSRLGSGSASRSIYGGFSVWGKTQVYSKSDDNFAVPVNETIHPAFSKLNDTVLLISSNPKAISSSQGHNLMKGHPYRQARINQANSNIHILCEALRKGDWDSFIQVTESEALSLHALMMSSSPGFILMEPSTLEIISRIREYRNRSSCPLCFTLDAGPNVHLIYHQNDQNEIREFIQQKLSPLCEKGKYIDDEVGTGPKRLK